MPLWAWGSDVYGRLGQGTEDRHLGRPTQVKALEHKQLTAAICGSAHNVIVDGEGQCYTWGKCHFGQLGHGEMDQNELVPRPVEALRGVRIGAVGAGDSHVLAVTTEGRVFTWGVGFYGCLGHGDETSLAVPKLVEKLQGVVSVTGGAFHSAAVTGDGKLLVWGRNHLGQIRLPPVEMPDYASGGTATKLVWLNQKEPVELKLPTACQAVSACNDHTLVLLQGGRVLSFGANNHGQLGRKSDQKKSPSGNDFHIDPNHFKSRDGKVEPVISVAAGWSHSAAITASGLLYTWGRGEHGELGLGHSRGAEEPCVVSQFAASRESPWFVSVSCGDSFTFALSREGQLWAFGSDDYGKLGVQGRGSQTTPIPLPWLTADPSVKEIAGICCGTNHTIVYT